MKIAYISVQRDMTGYSHAANDLILALDAAGLDVVNVWTTLSNNPKDYGNPRLAELERGNLDNVDVVIQHTLPQYFVRKSGVKNIGVFHYETNHFRGSRWAYSCNMMDEIWVYTPEEVEMCRRSGVTVPVIEIDAATDVGRFKQSYEPLLPELDPFYVFYTISELSFRKNVTSLIAAFYTAFTVRDNVALVIRGFRSEAPPESAERLIEQTINDLKSGVRRGSKTQRPPVIFISEWLDENKLMQLHSMGDCFVSLSRGESWCLPLFDAAAMGNICIGPNSGGPKKILWDSPHNILLPVVNKPVFGMNTSMSHLYNCDETWAEPQIGDCVKAMRQVAGTHPTRTQSYKFVENLLDKHAYREVGNKLKLQLEQST
jgi:glycosyltransferase involved in cell wall biosynthesis